MKYYYLLILSALVVGCVSVPVTVTESVKQSREEQQRLHDGVKEPYYPPYCWISPPGQDLWYPCGQNRTDEEIGQHGH